MKLKALLLAFAVAGLGASFGLTDTGRSDTGSTTGATTTTVATTTTSATTTTTSNDGCSKFELQGTLASVSGSSFSVNVTKGNHEAKGITGTTATIAVTADTRVSWSGRGTLTGPNQGDTVRVNGKQCGTTLTASKVDARGPKPAESGGDAKKHDSGSTTTTTSGSEGKDGKKK
jgi:hypothetical protein